MGWHRDSGSRQVVITVGALNLCLSNCESKLVKQKMNFLFLRHCRENLSYRPALILRPSVQRPTKKCQEQVRLYIKDGFHRAQLSV